MKICPNNPNHKEFITTGVEYHDWLIDADGTFIDDKGCLEARLGDGEWSCSTCHAIAIDSPKTIDPNQWAFDRNLESF